MSISDEENMAYAKALVICAKGDGEISPDERAWLIGYSVTQGHSEHVVETISTYGGDDSIEDVLGASPNMPGYGRFLVYDALRACSADGDLEASERERVKVMADRMGVSGEVVDELEQIVHQDHALRQRRFDILMADMSPA